MGEAEKRCRFLFLWYIQVLNVFIVFIQQEADNYPNAPQQPLADLCVGVTLLTVDLCAQLLISFCFKVNNIETKYQQSTEKFHLANLRRCNFCMTSLARADILRCPHDKRAPF